MEVGLRTPLLDMFRRGEVSRDVKMLAARGAMAPRAHEQLSLLVELVNDPDLEIRLAAEETIEAIPREALTAFLARSDTAATLKAIAGAAAAGRQAGLAVHAGHGLTYRNVQPVAAIPEIEELNIGHSIVSRAVFSGLATAVRDMLSLMSGYSL